MPPGEARTRSPLSRHRATKRAIRAEVRLPAIAILLHRGSPTLRLRRSRRGSSNIQRALQGNPASNGERSTLGPAAGRASHQAWLPAFDTDRTQRARHGGPNTARSQSQPFSVPASRRGKTRGTAPMTISGFSFFPRSPAKPEMKGLQFHFHPPVPPTNFSF